MRRLAIAVVAILALGLGLAIPWLAPPGQLPGDAPAPPAAATLEPLTQAGPVVQGVLVRDTDGRLAWRGDVDLGPTLQRIGSGIRDAHRNDGGVFGNREHLLPERPQGYYREYVVRTPGLAHAGPQRLIMGQAGELYYTSDHYASFRRVR